MDKNINISWLGWVIVLLPYEIGLLFMLFGSANFGQVLFFGTAFYALIEVRKYCIIFGEKADLSIIIRALSAFIKRTKRIFREFYLG